MNQLQSMAEFHDIGKLIDWKAIGLQATDKIGHPIEAEPHDFEKCTDLKWGIQFSAPIWESIFRKDPQIREAHYPGSLNWVFLSIADELAAGLGRIREEQVIGSPQYGYYCLWTGKTRTDPRLKLPQDLKELIEYLNKNPSWEETANRYAHILHSRAETARPGLNVTTLYSHSILAGKLFRVFSRFGSKSNQRFHSYTDALKTIGSQKINLVFVKVLFPQQPFRTRDLSIFQQRFKDIREITSRYENNVLITYAENILALFLSREEADSFINEVLRKGYLGLIRQGEKNLQELRSIGIDKSLGIERFLSRPLPDKISLPLCEACQMDHGDHRWPREMLAARDDISLQAKEYLLATPWQSIRIETLPSDDRARLAEWMEEWGEENLCSRCFHLRNQAETLKKLATWRTVTVAWAHLVLDLDSLVVALRQLHRSHIESLAERLQPGLLDRLPVRLPLLSNFVEEYQKFLGRWHYCVNKAFGQGAVEQVNDDLLCVRLTGRRQSLLLLEIHHKIMTEYFPKMLEEHNAPVRFALSIAQAKHPFFVHWRYLENPETAVCVQVINGGTATIPLKRLGDILRIIGRGDRRAIYRLRQIARTSQKLAEIVLTDHQDRDSKTFSQLNRIMPLGMNFESLVTLANLAEG